jgi:endo-1,4-beta-xylanase
LGVLFGTAVNPAKFSEEPYTAALIREFNMIEPENQMKWGAIRPQQQTFNFGPGDDVVTFGQARRMKVRGHNLLWAIYNPRWLREGKFSADRLSQIMHEHITKVAEHYKGQVFAWDVVNEAVDAKGKLGSSVWYDKPGIGLADKGAAYIEQAFRWAHEADPKALLFYNDFEAEGLNAKSDAIYAMVKDFKRRGVPIDGVGLQMHIFDLKAKDISTLSENMARIAALGLQVHITEMDVGLPVDGNGLANPDDLSRQAEIYGIVASACLRQPACTAFQTWGFTDKYTWIPGYTKGKKGAPLPFGKEYERKPAYRILLDAFSKASRQG